MDKKKLIHAILRHPLAPAVAMGTMVGLGGLWLISPNQGEANTLPDGSENTPRFEIGGSAEAPEWDYIDADPLRAASVAAPVPITAEQLLAKLAEESEPEPMVAPPPRAAAATGATHVSTVLRGSMPASLRKAVGDKKRGDELAAKYARLFMWHINLSRDLWAGDGLSVVYHIDEDKRIVVEAATLDSQKLQRNLTAYRFQSSTDAYPSYWFEDGTEVAERLKSSPMRHYEQITALLRDGRNHKGMDFLAPVGAEVRSPFAGTVTRVNWNKKANGLCVEVRYKDGTLAKFLHLSKTTVTAGQTVKAKQPIGLSGNTGRSTGPHLHYQLNKGANVVDPIDYHGTRRRKLSKDDLARLRGDVGRLRAMLHE